jgi:hypothetical protein
VARTSPTNGRIIYRITNGFELDELHNVSLNSEANFDLLVYETSTGLWKNKSLASINNGAGYSGQVTIDFGTVESSFVRHTVLNSKALTGSIILVSPSGLATADHDPDDYQWDNVSGYATNIVNGVSFDIIGVAPNETWGRYTMNYIIK